MCYFKILTITLLLWINALKLFAQPQLKAGKSTMLTFGYIYSSWENSTTDYHLAEILLVRSEYGKGSHYVALSKYAGVEFGLNTDRFTMGTKIGGAINYGPFIIGAEITCYTDFNEANLRLAPVFFGLGNHLYNLTMVPQIKVLNRDFNPTNQGQLNLTIRIANLRQTEKNLTKNHY